MISVIAPIDVAQGAVLSAVLLIALLVLKELASSMGRQWQPFARLLNIAVVPLLIAFFITVAIKIAEILP